MEAIDVIRGKNQTPMNEPVKKMTESYSKIIYVIFIVEMKKGLKKPMNKQDKQDLELILYRLNEQDKSVQKLESTSIKNSMKYTTIFHSSKKIYSIPMKAGKPNKTHNLEKTQLCGEL